MTSADQTLIRAVVFDVGEVLINESTEYGTWADWLGVEKTYRIMTELQAATGSDRYRPSLWLRRRAQLKLPVHTAD